MKMRNKKTGEIKKVSIKELNQYGLGGLTDIKNQLTNKPVFMKKGGGQFMFVNGGEILPMFGPGGSKTTSATFNPYANVNRVGSSDGTKVFRLNPEQVKKAKEAEATKNEKIVKEYQQRQSYIGPDKRTKAEIDKGIALKKEYDRIKAMQNSDLAKTFALFTPGNNIEAGVIGAETFANLNPLMSGPILATSRLAPAIMNPTNNEYWGPNKSNLENTFGVLGAIGDASMITPFFKGVPNYLTTQTPIKNTYNILPEGVFKGYSKLKNPNKSYRVAGLDAAEDFKNTGVVRSIQQGVPKGASLTERAMSRPTGFPSFQKSYADMRYAPEEGAVVFETELPTFKRGEINPVTGFPIKGRHYAHRVIDPKTGAVMTEIPAENIRVFGDKPNWLKGYSQIKAPKQFIDPKSGKVVYKQGFINPIGMVDKVVPRINPFSFIENGPDVMSFSPLNLIPGYGKKLVGTKNQAFRKFGNSIEDVAKRQVLSPAGGSKFRMGRDQIVNEGNWAALENPWEKYPGVFEATFDKTVPNNNISFLVKNNRSGVLIRDAEGNFLPEIPLTEPGMQLNRRLPFSTRYVPINKEKLINDEFQLATQLPYLQSLAEKYGILAGGAGAIGYITNGKKGAKKNINTLNKYTIDPIIKLYQKADEELNKGPKIYYKKGGQHGGLDRWFAEKWVDIKTGETCGRQEGEDRNYPACRPSKRISSATPKTASELSSAEKERFKREKTSSKKISYQHNRK